MFHTKDTVHIPDWKTWTAVSVGLLLLLPVVMAQTPPTPEPPKTERELQLEADLSACQTELEALKTPPVLEEDNAYIESIEDLQQRIQQVEQVR